MEEEVVGLNLSAFLHEQEGRHVGLIVPFQVTQLIWILPIFAEIITNCISLLCKGDLFKVSVFC